MKCYFEILVMQEKEPILAIIVWTLDRKIYRLGSRFGFTQILVSTPNSHERFLHLNHVMRKHALCEQKRHRSASSSSVAEQAGLSLTWSGTLENRFSHCVAQVILYKFFVPRLFSKKREGT